ncbi:hypothetical protein FNF29_05401 [Cafeteria roenbergensis]|uniref:Non-haem dioxygenase N-terminal domain-containing protein n=1 Tax=Cafeteria roenbergensis TaxID=33653 RepID=A0A5A8CDM1_CAFRO|nr:hypothetical protein FNF29_05401 [Cafeteria roenbergensis]|eukprot:KAA0150160.1 hypothetical protein FNF29_05401 [Cafeteria roenbergensis]
MLAARSVVSATARALSRPAGARAFASAPVEADVVMIDYAELTDPSPPPSLIGRIQRAYGPNGLGILAVSNVPDYEERRKALLPLARRLASLPEDELTKLEDPASFYSVGWSHGKEVFQGKPDLAKGSFYANPLHNEVDLSALGEEEAARLRKEYAPFLAANRWPESIPELEDAFMQLGSLIVSTGALVGRACDALVAASGVGETSSLEEVVMQSRVPKGRLLWYFPVEEPAADSATAFDGAIDDSWCGWHNDHGSLTGLCRAMFVDEDGNEASVTDPAAGLYARARDGTVARVTLPEGCMGFQIGETAQVCSGGVLQATPHAVRAAGAPGIGRAQLAVFMEPEWDGKMELPSGISHEDVMRDAKGRVLPKGVPSLAGRFEVGDTFGTFSDKTLKEYYG